MNKSKFLMSEGSSFNIRQPSYNKKKWDDNSDADVINSSTFEYKKEYCDNSDKENKILNINNNSGYLNTNLKNVK